MRISGDAIIPRAKLTQYLLIPREVDDKAKFLAQAGFTLADPGMLEAAIHELIQTHDAIYDLTNEYGDFYRVEGPLIGPTGELVVVTIWLLQTGSDGSFRFVTLKPKR
jgi:hypothetical protein